MSTDDRQTRRIGKYVLIQKLGQGGMGTVYLAHQKDLNRPVALKVLSPALSRDEIFVKRFKREAILAASVSHPNIVQIYEQGADKKLHYFAMEFVEGTPLDELLKNQSGVSVERALEIVFKSALALHFAHERGLVHRDIKCANIMIDTHGEPRIMDFGLARGLEGSKLTAIGAIMGTPYYMSPEQAQGTPADCRSDIYSLGVVMFEMLCGAVPFRAPTPHEVLEHHTNTRAPCVRERNPSVSSPVAAVVEKCLRKMPGERYQTAAEMAETIQTCLAWEEGKHADTFPVGDLEAVSERAEGEAAASAHMAETVKIENPDGTHSDSSRVGGEE